VTNPVRTPDSPGPLWDAFLALSENDLQQLGLFAAWRLKALGCLAGERTSLDLLHEAMVRFADGTRRLPQGFPLKYALIGAMRSIAYAWGQNSRHGAYDNSHSETPFDEEKCNVEVITPERLYGARERLNTVYDAFKNDLEGLTVVQGWGLGMTGLEIQQLMEVDEDTYLAIAKRVRRVLAKLETPNV
jgi:hypothetical protein